MVLRGSVHFAGWILAASAALLAGCSQPRTAEDRKTVPEIRLEGVRFRLFRGDAIRAQGTAATLTYQRDSTAVRAEGVEIRLRERPADLLVAAPTADGVVSARTFEARGGIVATRGTDSARTASARFDPAAGAEGGVVGEEPVELTGKGYRMRGNGFTLDPAEGQIALRGGTRLVMGAR